MDKTKGRYILISVSEREIETLYFRDYKTAHKVMKKQLDETGSRRHNAKSIDYDFDKYSAWSNMNQDCKCDWLIEKIPDNNVGGVSDA